MSGSVYGTQGRRGQPTTSSSRYPNGSIYTQSWRQPQNLQSGQSLAGSVAGTTTVPSAAGAQSVYASTAYNAIGHGRTNTTPKDYTPGMIIVTYHHLPNMNPNALATDPSIGYVPETGHVSGKRRPFVVLSVTATHMKCIPMYSSGGRGYSQRPRIEQQECIYVRHWSDDGEEWVGVRPHQYLMLDNKTTGKSGSYIIWTRTCDVPYDWPIFVMGAIASLSYNRLRSMHTIGYRMAFLELDKQYEWARQQQKNIAVTNEYETMRAAELGNQKPTSQPTARNGTLSPDDSATSQPETEDKTREWTVVTRK